MTQLPSIELYVLGYTLKYITTMTYNSTDVIFDDSFYCGLRA